MSYVHDRMTREEAARYLGVQPRTLEIWATTGRYNLPYIRVGRRVQYSKSDLDRFLQAKKIYPAGADKQK